MASYMYQSPNLPPSIYLDPYQQPQFSPFVPTGHFSTSPFSNPTSLPGTPHVLHSPLPAQHSPNTVLFPASGQIYAEPVWAVPITPMRERRPSFNAPLASPTPTWLQSPPQRQRTMSSGHNPYFQPQPTGLYSNWPQALPTGYAYPFSPVVAPTPFTPGFANLPTMSPMSHQLFMHPWLNGEVPRDDFIFDLSSSIFNPLRVIGPGQVYPVAQEEFVQPATHPPITELTIICDAIPDWPIEIKPSYYTGHTPPITFGDILGKIYGELHQPISHVDWAKLSTRQSNEITKAYSRRCRAAGSLDEVEKISAAGVRRVDYLLDKTRFRGLVRMYGDGDSMKMKLILGSAAA